MATYVIQRLLHTVMIAFLLVTLVFFLLQFTGDPAQMMLPQDATQQQVEELTQHLGLDQPWYVQYGLFLRNALGGDFGTSFYYDASAFHVVLERLPATLELLGVAMFISLVVSILLGVVAGSNQGRWVDRIILVFSLVGISSPVFFIAIMLVLIFSLNLGWFPASGRSTFLHVVLPASSLALFRIAVGTRVLRASMIEVLNQDFIRTARAKALARRVILYKHALRNALLPYLTIFGLQMGAVLAGAIVTETIFAWPGIGRLLILSVQRLDNPVIIAYTVVVAIGFALINLLVDIAYGVLDPRIRYG
jgi:peptide/nickel transport system permease protein